MIVSILYAILIALSFWALYQLLRNVTGRNSSYYVVLFTLISVVCMAYFAYSLANNEGMALVANQFTYFDGTFMLMFFLFCVLDICGMRVRKSVGIPLTACCIAILALAFTTGKLDLFYVSVDFEKSLGASHLIMNFGPLHNPFLVYVVLNTLAPMGIVIYSVFHKKKISYRYTMALGTLELAIMSIYFIEYAFGVPFDLLPFGYVLMEYVILAIIRRIALYDGTQVVLQNSENRREFGYIIFDTKKAYVSANEVARLYFPQINDLDIDRPVTDPFIKENFVEKMMYVQDLGTVSQTHQLGDRYIISSIKPYVDVRKQKVRGYIVELRDDTEQQLMIQKLESMNGELELAVETANKANAAKSEFLASMSHEIRTPINAILGMDEIAMRECNDPELISYLNDIRTAGKNLLFIINDILDFSKIEAGKIDLIEAEYCVGQTIKEVRDLIEIKATEKNLGFHVWMDEGLPMGLKGDENRIRQIMVNILNNAVKYTKEGHVDFRIFSQKGENGEFELVFSVKDTGIGIREEDKAALFQSFTRVDEKNNKNIEGTGLGLAITQRLIDLMGGTITVDSVYGEGSTFTVVLPQQVLNATPMGEIQKYSEESRKKKEDYAHIDASGVDILVVDDTRMNLNVVKGLLKVTKAKVDTCSSGTECLYMLSQKHYDIILLDHLMPEMDGIETLKRAKSMENNLSADGVYIALTANAITGVREMYLENGFDDYLSKPIDSQRLERTIEAYMERRRDEKG